GGLVVMAAWLYWAGMPLFVVPLFLLGVLAIFLAITRVVIESGMAEAVPPTVPAGFTHAVLGNQAVGAQGMVTQSLSYIWAGDMRTLVMTSAAHGYRLSEVVRDNRRALTGAMFLAIPITALAAIITTLYLGYTHGGVSLNPWFFIDGAQWPYKWMAERNANPVGPNYSGWALAVGGGLFAWFLAFMRQRYVWWPFHPVGFAIAPTWIVNEIWLSAFIAWLLRGLIVRYGGLRGHRRAWQPDLLDLATSRPPLCLLRISFGNAWLTRQAKPCRCGALPGSALRSLDCQGTLLNGSRLCLAISA